MGRAKRPGNLPGEGNSGLRPQAELLEALVEAFRAKGGTGLCHPDVAGLDDHVFERQLSIPMGVVEERPAGGFPRPALAVDFILGLNHPHLEGNGAGDGFES